MKSVNVRRTASPWLGALAFCTLTLAAFPVQAHIAEGMAGGLVSGFLHPVLGLDHVVAMIAVGLWGAFLGGSAIWMLPIVFPLVMALGGVLGIMGVPIPYVEAGIAGSAIILGLMVAGAIRPPLWVAGLIVGGFAIFHGHAHGTELPQAANAMSYSIGFVVATGLLHLTGIAFGLLTKWSSGKVLVRTGGAAIALAGVVFLAS
jgi:urease accessory protein